MADMDMILKNACRIAEEDIAKNEFSRLNKIPDIKTSGNFDERINKIIRRMKSVKRRGTKKFFRVLILVAALIVVFSVTAIGATPFHEKIKYFFMETFHDVSTVEFENSNSTRGTLYSKYSYIPAGYEMTNHTQDSRYEKYTFEDVEGNQLFCTSRANDNSLSMLDTEDIVPEEITINKSSALYYSKENFSRVTWSTGEYHYSIYQYSSTNQITKDELIKMAESRENVY